MEDFEKVRGVALQIVKENPDCLISGSLGLKMSGIKTRREAVGDIDIYLPYSIKFKPLKGMHYSYSSTTSEEDYVDEYYQRESLLYNGIKIDVFTPLEESADIPLNDIDSSLKVLAPHVIIGFKVHHFLLNASSAEKHREDIQFIINNN